MIAHPDGEVVPGPEVKWTGRRHGRRVDRRWAKSWSPEQISNRLRIEFPDNESMRISHDAIYQAAYVQGRGGLQRELVACLRTGRALRVPRARTRQRGRKFVTPEILIAQRPAEADDRAVPGHWEGDLILGVRSSAIGTLVERTTRFTMLLHLPPMAGHREGKRVHNGPRPCRPRRPGRTRRHRCVDHDTARTAPAVADLGPGRRDGPACSTPRRCRPRRLLLRPALTMAAWNQPQHQRSPPSILTQRHRPQPTLKRPPGRRRCSPQRSTPQNPRLEDPSRGPHRTPRLPQTKQCCDDPLNLVNTPRGRSGPAASRLASRCRWDAEATPTTTQ